LWYNEYMVENIRSATENTPNPTLFSSVRRFISDWFKPNPHDILKPFVYKPSLSNRDDIRSQRIRDKVTMPQGKVIESQRVTGNIKVTDTSHGWGTRNRSSAS
jgi:hypothetical protein